MKMLDRHRDSIEGASEAVPVEITSVANWVLEHSPNRQVKSMPCLAPPWEKAWYEYTPSEETRDYGIKRIGVMVSGFEADGVPITVFGKGKAVQEHDEVQWITSSELYLEKEFGASRTIIPVASMLLFLDEEGHCNGKTAAKPMEGAAHFDVSVDELLQGSTWWIKIALYAQQFLHCKNVELVDIPIPQKVQENRKSKGQHPGVQYKTLEIEPMKRQTRREQEEGETEMDRALHICRGHFKDYREKGLFGQDSHKGIYWWDQHVRGSKEHGEVRKDYEVHSPN